MYVLRYIIVDGTTIRTKLISSIEFETMLTGCASALPVTLLHVRAFLHVYMFVEFAMRIRYEPLLHRIELESRI